MSSEFGHESISISFCHLQCGAARSPNISTNRDYARQDLADVFSVRIFDITLIDLGVNHGCINALMP